VLWIQSVYVDSAFRKRGIYAALYSHIKTLVTADQELKGIRLYVDESNKKAMEVYARLGMNGEHYRVFEWMKE
jgi:ribosomal protein S18 acetylase RimI-like enzyme